MEPRNGDRCGNADRVQWLAGSSPARHMARAEDTTGVCERGMSAQGARGHVGAPPVSLWPTRPGGPGAQKPWRGRGLPRDHAPSWDTQNYGRRHGSGKGSDKRSPRKGQRAGGAAHRTGEGGEGRPKRPTGGKVPSGSACHGQTHERDCALTHRVPRPPLDGTKGQQRRCLRHRMRSLRTSGSVGGPDGHPSALPGSRPPTASAALPPLAAAHRGRSAPKT